MYESYWQLADRPFENHSDSRFYYPAESHQGALLKLRYAIENRRGAAVLAGVSGSGKTLLADVLHRQVSATCPVFVRLVFPRMSTAELLAFLTAELSGDVSLPMIRTVPSIDHSVRRLQEILSNLAMQSRHAIIVIDEAHLIQDVQTLETLRLLLNFDINGTLPFTLLLVGQTGLLRTLERMPDFEERIGVKCLLRPLTCEETSAYVSARLNAASAQREIFDGGAIETLHLLSHGLPRRINRLCDLALLVGYAEEREIITADLIEAVAEELVTVSAE
ncbi:MAG: AAA family ATPase [Planctomycetota bacterium]|nr:AAA family ATPase [Planctomycetota bacterium]